MTGEGQSHGRAANQQRASSRLTQSMLPSAFRPDLSSGAIKWDGEHHERSGPTAGYGGGTPPSVRMCGAGAAGRRRARGLSGRRLRGAERSRHRTDWIAGISIGAINAAIIAGNPPDSRIDRLREFWTQVTADSPWSCADPAFGGLGRRRAPSSQPDERGLCDGERSTGIFRRTPGAAVVSARRHDRRHQFLRHQRSQGTLERLVDFDRLNAGATRSAWVRSM